MLFPNLKILWSLLTVSINSYIGYFIMVNSWASFCVSVCLKETIFAIISCVLLHCASWFQIKSLKIIPASFCTSCCRVIYNHNSIKFPPLGINITHWTFFSLYLFLPWCAYIFQLYFKNWSPLINIFSHFHR